MTAIETSTRRPTVALVLGAGAVIGVVTFVVAVLAMAVGIATGSAESGVGMMLVVGALLRSALSLLVVYAVIRLAAVRGERAAPIWWVLAALLGYVLNLMSWGGNALFTALLVGGVEQGVGVRVLGFVADAVIWGGVAFLAAVTADRTPVRDSTSGLH